IRDFHVTGVQTCALPISKKIRAALDAKLIPILCVGETESERKNGKTEEVLLRQLHGSLATTTANEIANIVIAYEPVWAIGTGNKIGRASCRERGWGGVGG